ncbi:lmbr1-like conserved region family protein, putative [Ichthyophthirius multifiliis]|uniref:Lmbr1-like conserved region family protein, putative n=1 Tax=Ichthyophthirius multifiliis TaxID=5932 RepID=G0R5W2_ICHMU|nr:lmbr1-like conserved region family protein, putative [Ichthyophthirius multifiliis]EGR27139.1 lmbr1-like conserved region family protein, putative [Ichthyophthirius multifiliis]|eukprot:XP_004024023.1 lmbr1-like conserved region family protein, putative [Ichthyophthirius multifiliis]
MNIVKKVYPYLQKQQFIFLGQYHLVLLVLPILQEYEDAGEFTKEQKLKRSLVNNLIIYGIFGVFGGLFMAYLFYIGQMKMQRYKKLKKIILYNYKQFLKIKNIQIKIQKSNNYFFYLQILYFFIRESMMDFFACLSNYFGQLLVVLLLGHGLVAIPRKYLNLRSQELNLQYYQGQAKSIEANLLKSKFQIEYTIKQLYFIREQFKETEYSQLCDYIIKVIPKSLKNQIEKQSLIDEKFKGLNEINMNKIIQLHKEIKKQLGDYYRNETKWNMLLQNIFLIEDILENQYSINNKIRSTFWVERRDLIGNFFDKLQWLWYVKLKSKIFFGLGIIFSISSIFIVYCELCIFFNINQYQSIINIKQDYFFMQLQMIAPLLYISFCTYYGLFRIQYSGFYCFFKQQNTDGPSLLFGSINFARVSVALCTNFLKIVRVNNTTYEKVMGQFDFQIFGKFSIFFFSFILVLFTLLNLFDIYDNLLQKFNLHQFEFTPQSKPDDIEEGKKILYKGFTFLINIIFLFIFLARLQQERSLLSRQSTNLNNFAGYMNNFSINSFRVSHFYHNDEENKIKQEQKKAKQIFFKNPKYMNQQDDIIKV